MSVIRNEYLNAPLHPNEWEEVLSSAHDQQKAAFKEYLEGKPVEVLAFLHIEEKRRDFDVTPAIPFQDGQAKRIVNLYSRFVKAHEAAQERKRNFHLAIAALIISLASASIALFA